MIDEILQDAEERMKKSLGALGQAFKKIRTGRANPSLLDGIMVSYYGSNTPLSQVANVAIEDSRTLSITPWETPMIAAIEKAIMASDLGLNPSTASTTIRVPLPALTEETRKELIKVAKAEAENARIAVRNIRRDANNDFKELLKEKEISEDEDRGAHDRVQKITDKLVAEIDQTLAKKEADLLEV